MEKFTIDQLLSGGALSALVGLLTWFTTSRTSKRQHRVDALARASDLYRDMSASDRARMEFLAKRLDDHGAKLEALDVRNAELVEENRRFRIIISDLLRWLNELVVWEANGCKPPPPYTANELVSRINNLTEGLDVK